MFNLTQMKAGESVFFEYFYDTHFYAFQTQKKSSISADLSPR